MKFPKEYYPTPAPLAWEMQRMIDWNYVHTILEPSAGTGDLISAIAKNDRNFDGRSVDCAEIDHELQEVLKGHGFRIVADDFLNYHPFTRYDAIVMNPPFSQGARHLLHAIELQKHGGQIVCLLNAETIKNPCTVERQRLKNYIEEYGAKVEFRQGSFRAADRKTDVEVAIVYFNIPREEWPSDILQNLRASMIQEEKEQAPQEENRVAENDVFRALVRQYEFEARVGIKLIEEYQAIAPRITKEFAKDGKNRSDAVLSLDMAGSRGEPATVNRYLQDIRSKYWQALFRTQEMSKLLTEGMQQKYWDRMNDLRNYEFDMHNIMQLRSDVSAQMLESLDETILKLFDDLGYAHSMERSGNVHYYDGWKTNKAYKISKRVVIPCYGLYEWEHFQLYQAKKQLSDIEKVFTYLDPAPEDGPDVFKTMDGLNDRADQIRGIQFKYFTADFFKKGTIHLTFTNDKLLKKFNLFGSQHKGWLPPSYGKSAYEDMARDERTVVDKFEGRESYEETLKEKHFYLPDKPAGLLMLEA